MTIKNDTKIEEELTLHFKTDTTNLTNFNPSTRKSKKFALIGSLDQSISYILSQKKYGGVMFDGTEDF